VPPAENPMKGLVKMDGTVKECIRAITTLYNTISRANWLDETQIENVRVEWESLVSGISMHIIMRMLMSTPSPCQLIPHRSDC
jgi:hypothetical protein